MNVLLIGPVSFPGGLVGSYARAFRQLGDVVVFDTVKEALGPLYSPHDSLWVRAARRLARYVSYAAFRRKLLSQVSSSACQGLDLVIDFGSQWLDPDTLQSLRQRRDVPIVHFNADSPFDAANAHPNLVACIPVYDCYLTPYRALEPSLRDAGARDVVYVPFAWDPELHPYEPAADMSRAYIYQLAFAGSWTAEREAWLDGVSDLGLAIWGPRWGRARSAPLQGCVQAGPLVFGGPQFATVAREAKINLNFLRPQCAGAHNMRTFEVPGAGGFLLTERSVEQSEFFTEGEEIACFSTVAELRERVKTYLPRDAQRERMAVAAQAKAAQHTYRDRARSILSACRALVGTALAAG